MILPRVIPVLLLSGKGLVKGVQFKNHVYVGDPINAVQIFNSKEVDEVLFLDISATNECRITPTEVIQGIANQCLMPFGVGGGIRSVDDAHRILSAGAEKVCVNTGAMENPKLVTDLSERFGRQSVVVSIDVKQTSEGQYEAFSRCGTRVISRDPVALAQQMESSGAGEILVNSIDRDGTGMGYDLGILKPVASAITVPMIALGGAGTDAHMKEALDIGCASASAAGSRFVFHGKRRAVLISFPSPQELIDIRGGDTRERH